MTTDPTARSRRPGPARRPALLARCCPRSGQPRALARRRAPAAARRRPTSRPTTSASRPPCRPTWPGRSRAQLTLAEAIETSLRRNLAVALEREQVREADTGRDLGPGRAFDPVLLGVGRPGRVPLAAADPAGRAGRARSSRAPSDAGTLALAQRLPTGTELRLDFLNSRTESALGTAVAPEVFRSSLSLRPVAAAAARLLVLRPHPAGARAAGRVRQRGRPARRRACARC